MYISNVFTYNDCIEHLIQYQGGASSDADLGKLRTAVQMAYQDLCWNMEWQYYHRPLRIQLSAYYATGTIEYTSSTRTLTLTTGTWPTWAASGRVLIAGIAYQVKSRTSNSELILDETFCPQANIASGTAYRIYRSVYLLPKDFRKVHEFVGEDTWTSTFTTPSEWLKRERFLQDTGTPWLWTIMQTTDVYGYGRYGLFVSGYPDTAETFDCIYLRAPREIKYTGYETAARTTAAGVGTVSAAASASVTGTSTAFSSDMVGSVIRFTTGSTVPGGVHTTNPFTEQHTISAYSSATAITLDEATTGSYTTKPFLITDPMDCPLAWRQALLRSCEYELDSLLPSSERLKRSYSAKREALIQARERDSLTNVRALETGYFNDRFRDTLGSDQ
jgi:hypothetical protein